MMKVLGADSILGRLCRTGIGHGSVSCLATRGDFNFMRNSWCHRPLSGRRIGHLSLGGGFDKVSTGFGFPVDRHKHLKNGLVLRAFCSDQDQQSVETEMKTALAGKLLEKGILTKVAEGLESVSNKPEICTADELHYVALPGTSWKLALWRYLPERNAPKRNHPLLLLSGIGTNAIGFDLDKEVSMARHMAGQGFDTWILEVRGSGLSITKEESGSNDNQVVDTRAIHTEGLNGALEESVGTSNAASKPQDSMESVSRETINTGAVGKTDETSLETMKMEKTDDTSWETMKTATRLFNTILHLSERFRNSLTEGQSTVLLSRFVEHVSSLLEDYVFSSRIVGLRERLANLLDDRQSKSVVATQVSDLVKWWAKVLEDGQRSVSPRVTDLQERLTATMDDFQKVVDLIAKYDWDFDNYLEEDVPAAINYILEQCRPVDGKVLGAGHSMGGIVLYALLATRGRDILAEAGEQSGLAGAVTIASALDYGVSDSSLKLLLPLADPAQLLNVPVVPLGALMAAVHPLVSRPPYALAYLGYQVSARKMMEPAHFNKLILNNFCTIPVKLLLHLATTFQPDGLQNRDGTICYKKLLGQCTVPLLALAGDKDLICPPKAVLETVKEFPAGQVQFEVFGGSEERHYGHYDLVCSRAAKEEVFPVIQEFLVECDEVKVEASYSG